MKKKKIFAGIISFLLLFGFVSVDLAQAQQSGRDPHHPSNSPRGETEYDRRMRIQQENNERERQRQQAEQQRQREAEQQRQREAEQQRQREAEQQQQRDAEQQQPSGGAAIFWW